MKEENKNKYQEFYRNIVAKFMIFQEKAANTIQRSAYIVKYAELILLLLISIEDPGPMNSWMFRGSVRIRFFSLVRSGLKKLIPV